MIHYFINSMMYVAAILTLRIWFINKQHEKKILKYSKIVHSQINPLVVLLHLTPRLLAYSCFRSRFLASSSYAFRSFSITRSFRWSRSISALWEASSIISSAASLWLARLIFFPFSNVDYIMTMTTAVPNGATLLLRFPKHSLLWRHNSCIADMIITFSKNDCFMGLKTVCNSFHFFANLLSSILKILDPNCCNCSLNHSVIELITAKFDAD